MKAKYVGTLRGTIMSVRNNTHNTRQWKMVRSSQNSHSNTNITTSVLVYGVRPCCICIYVRIYIYSSNYI